MSMHPEDIQRLQEEEAEKAVHEGDSVIFVRLSMAAGRAGEMGKRGMQDKINLAYIRYSITVEQWRKLYAIMDIAVPAKPVRDLDSIHRKR